MIGPTGRSPVADYEKIVLCCPPVAWRLGSGGGSSYQATGGGGGGGRPERHFGGYLLPTVFSHSTTQSL